MGDINGLKLINDALGHNEGDKLIRIIAEIILSCCDNGEIVGRIGGDNLAYYCLIQEPMKFTKNETDRKGLL